MNTSLKDIRNVKPVRANNVIQKNKIPRLNVTLATPREKQSVSSILLSRTFRHFLNTQPN